MIETGPERYRVLLVEDNADFQQLFRVYASKKNLEVVTAATGRNAISMLARKQFDCLLLDYMLPDLNGAEVFRYMRQEPRWQNEHPLPAIVISAVTIPPHTLESLYRSGVLLFLPKSFGLRELVVVVETLCFASRHCRHEFWNTFMSGVSGSWARGPDTRFDQAMYSKL